MKSIDVDPEEQTYIWIYEIYIYISTRNTSLINKYRIIHIYISYTVHVFLFGVTSLLVNIGECIVRVIDTETLRRLKKK